MSLLTKILEAEKHPMSYESNIRLIEKSLSLEDLNELKENLQKTYYEHSYLIAVEKRENEIKSSDLYYYYKIGKRICKKNNS